MALVDQDSAQVRFPPPLLVLGLLLLGVAAGLAFGVPRIDVSALRPIGVVVAAAGFAILASGLFGFFKAGNDPEPWKKDSALVTGGLYRFTRNPMYLGMVLVQLGVALFAQSIGGLLSVPLAMILLQRFVIAREERHLHATFGDEYGAYQQRVRRWL